MPCELELETKWNKRKWRGAAVHVKQDGCRDCFVAGLCNEEQAWLCDA